MFKMKYESDVPKYSTVMQLYWGRSVMVVLSVLRHTFQLWHISSRYDISQLRYSHPESSSTCTPTVSPQAMKALWASGLKASKDTILVIHTTLGAIFNNAGMWSAVVKMILRCAWLILDNDEGRLTPKKWSHIHILCGKVIRPDQKTNKNKSLTYRILAKGIVKTNSDFVVSM
jgi:hypothetical protein